MLFNISRKYRIYPNQEQIQIIERTFGACRYVWNKMVEAVNYQYENHLPFTIPNYSDIALETDWLLDKSVKLDRHAIGNIKMFFKQSFIQCMKKFKEKKEFRKDGKPKGFPRFKSKRVDRNSFSNYHYYQTHINFTNYMLKLPVIGLINFNKREKQIPDNWKIKHYTISRKANKYYCSFCFEYEDNDPLLKPLNEKQLPNDEVCHLGLDYKSNGLYMDSNGNLANYPRFFRKAQKRLKQLQQKYSRQQKGDKNKQKTLLKIQQFHDHISNQRKDFLHKLSTAITKQYDVICVEDIDMRAISQMLKLGKSTMDNGFGMFRLMLEYKCLREPFKALIKIPRFFPSSKTCSFCGYKNDDLTLADRTYNCPCCGNIIDRDLNAAINLRHYGFQLVNGIES